MKNNHVFISIAIVVIIFGTIITTSALGIWKTTSSKIPAKYQNGEAKGEYNPADIRGSYTFGEISNIFNISLDDLGNAFAVENKNSFSTFQCKSLEEIYSIKKNSGKEIGTNSVRIFVALYKGLPIELDNTTFFPETAEEVLLKAGKLTDEQKAFVNTHLVKPEKSSKIASNKEDETSSFIKGKTTFKEVLAAGVKKERIEEVLNIEIKDTSIVIKDFCSDNGLEFSTVKSEIQTLINEK